MGCSNYLNYEMGLCWEILWLKGGNINYLAGGVRKHIEPVRLTRSPCQSPCDSPLFGVTHIRTRAYVYVYTYTYIYIYVYIHIYICVCVCVCVYIYMSTYTRCYRMHIQA